MSHGDDISVSSSHESAWSDAEDTTYEFKALHDNEVFDSLETFLNHEKIKHNFDLIRLRREHKLDIYGTMCVINCVRSTRMSEHEVTKAISEIVANKTYLLPVLEDDAVLFHLSDDDDDDAGNNQHNTQSELELRYEALDAQFQLLNAAFKASVNARPSVDDKPDNDSYYFDSYGYNDIHETMLKDRVRTDAYRDAVYDNKSVINGKVILDVGCGTGILSMFCAKAGAKHVYAIDNSNIIEKARSNAYENGLADNITFIKGKVEDIQLPVSQVDIIISEWMGYALLYESMLDSVLVARVRFLSPDGLMMPSLTTMVIAGLSDKDYFDDRVNFWTDVYGFKMSAMKDGIFDDILIDSLSSNSLGTLPSVFNSLDLHTVAVSNLVFKRTFTLSPLPGHSSIIAFHIWFDTYFTQSRNVKERTREFVKGSEKTLDGNAFSTGPYGHRTHWKQAVLLIDGEVNLSEQAYIDGSIEYRKGANNPRFLEIIINWTVRSGDGQQKGASRSQTWHLA